MNSKENPKGNDQTAATVQQLLKAVTELQSRLNELENQIDHPRNSPHEIYLKPKEVERYVPGLTADILKVMRSNGTSPPYFHPTTGRVYYRLSDLVGWLENNRNTTPRRNRVKS